MSLQLWGIIFIAAGLIMLALWGAYRYWAALELHRLRESVTFVSPVDPKVRTFPIYGGVYDWEKEGDL